MEGTPLYCQTYHVGLNDVDFTRKLKLSALFNYFQDIANLAAENLGVGMTRVEQEFGVAWILVRIRVDMIRQPDWDEEITIDTWPQVPGKVDFERDYLVKDREGLAVARAVSQWVIMDIKQRRLRRTNLIPLSLSSIPQERAIDCQLGKLRVPEQLEMAYKRVIGYSDIDVNGHLNNCKYVDFILDCFPLASHQQQRVTSIEVNFINEVLPGDTIALRREIVPLNPQVPYIEGINEQNRQVVFRAQLELANRI